MTFLLTRWSLARHPKCPGSSNRWWFNKDIFCVTWQVCIPFGGQDLHPCRAQSCRNGKHKVLQWITASNGEWAASTSTPLGLDPGFLLTRGTKPDTGFWFNAYPSSCGMTQGLHAHGPTPAPPSLWSDSFDAILYGIPGLCIRHSLSSFISGVG